MTDENENSEFDVFISHASEDKYDVARPLHDALVERGLSVWLDELQLVIGDSLRTEIDRALSRSRFGVVILSPYFFAKEWPGKELDGLTAIEVRRGKTILPVWHNVDYNAVSKISPILADKIASKTDKGIDIVASDIVVAIQRAGTAIATPTLRSSPNELKTFISPKVAPNDTSVEQIPKNEFKNGSNGGFLYRLNRLQGLFGLLAVSVGVITIILTYLNSDPSNAPVPLEVPSSPVQPNDVKESPSKWTDFDIVYFEKEADRGMVIEVLETLPPSVVTIKSTNSTDATNAMWYGSNIDRERVNELAIKLLNAGVSLQFVGPFRNSSNKSEIVEIGTSKFQQRHIVLTVDEVKAGHTISPSMSEASPEIESVLSIIDSPDQSFDNLASRITQQKDVVINQNAELSAIKTDDLEQLLTEFASYVDTINKSPNVAESAYLAAKRHLRKDNDVIKRLFDVAKETPEPLNTTLTAIANESWEAIFNETKRHIHSKWDQTVYPNCINSIAGRYPANKNSDRDSPLLDFGEFFGIGGDIDRFVQTYLEPFLDRNQFQPIAVDEREIRFDPDFINHLKMFRNIQSIYFPTESKQPTASFYIKPISMSANAHKSFLSIDGQSMAYDNGPSIERLFKWPVGNETDEVRLYFEGSTYESSRVLEFQGPWAWFRLLDYAKRTGQTQTESTVEFKIDNYWIRHRIRADRANNPFAGNKDPISQFQCWKADTSSSG